MDFRFPGAILTLSLMAVVSAPQARADDTMNACADDATQFCASETGNSYATEQCLEDHYKEISDDCYSALKRAADQTDAAPPDGPSDNGSAAAAGDENAQPPMEGGNMGQMGHGGGPGDRMREACGSDVRKYCGGVQPGAGRIIACLNEHMSELSGSCSSVLSNMDTRRSARGGE